MPPVSRVTAKRQQNLGRQRRGLLLRQQQHVVSPYSPANCGLQSPAASLATAESDFVGMRGANVVLQILRNTPTRQHDQDGRGARR